MGDSDFSREKYFDIPLEPVPRVTWDDPKTYDYITSNKPVIIVDSRLAGPCEKWDLDYLENSMKETLCTVIFSKTRNFKYFDDKSVRPEVRAKFVPPTRKENIKLAEFTKRLKNWKEGDERMYLQQTLNPLVGVNIFTDFLKCNWSMLSTIQNYAPWGNLTSNLLLIAMEGNVTPCHYDEQQNLFTQLKGYKRFLLFPPEQFECFYPYPVYHPHDRQSQVDFDNVDHERFPMFRKAKGVEAIVGPGEVLYIPVYWWHHVQSLVKGGDYNMSLNFWYKSVQLHPPRYPLEGAHKVAIMRNTEKMLLETLKSTEELGELLKTLVLGRYL